MSEPVTTLSDIILLAHKQYGIRFQVSQPQLVAFCNTIQYIAYNKDLKVFEDWGQIFFLGQDVFLETAGTYTAPLSTDIGKNVSGTASGVIGKLMNFRTQNRGNRWIIEPPDGGTNFVLTDSEVLTIVGGSPATGVVCKSQKYNVSSGPYKVPGIADGNPPFRKLIGVTTVTDKQIFNVPPQTSFDGLDDFGLALNNVPGRRQFFPYRFDMNELEITLVTTVPPTIEQTDDLCGPLGTTLNTSKLRWAYYRNPPSITLITDESKLVIPEQYRYEILFKGISKLADIATYGDAESIRQIIEPLCERFWEDMSTQYQAFGRGSDYISMGDAFDNYGMGLSSKWGNRGQRWG